MQLTGRFSKADFAWFAKVTWSEATTTLADE
jgi:hypothetical protein